MGVYELKDNRMVCWDNFLIDKMDNADIVMHKPTKRELVFTADAQWEGNCTGYERLIKIGDKYRFYYRGGNIILRPDGTDDWGKCAFCVCETTDFKNFKRMPVNKYDFDGIKHNNIFLLELRDNFSIFYDENPDCPKEEKFKALSMSYEHEEGGHGLAMYVSEDGIDFKRKMKLPIPGTFDSYNVMLWDKETKQYFFFYRAEHRVDFGDIEFDVFQKAREIHREVRVCTTKDFENFEYFGELDYMGDEYPMQFYTNQIEKYYRTKDMFIGFPARYIDHWDNEENFKYLPLPERHKFMTERFGREGTALTDCSIITSRDGYHFNKCNEAFLTPGIEANNNWWYGNCYTAYGMVETPSDIEGEPNEISFINGDNYRIKAIDYYRYTIRLDGFFSWYAKYKGGNILTKPFTFEGNELEINFASSAFGGIKIVICDEDGNAIDGYESIKHIGDNVNRKIDFKKPLSELNGKPVRLSIELSDCDLYSFKFNK